MKKKRFLNLCLKTINFFIPKIKRSIYLNLSLSSKNNYEDIINSSGNNRLKFVHDITAKEYVRPLHIFVEYFDDSRKDLYYELARTAKEHNVYLKFVRACSDKKGFKKLKREIIKYYFLFRCTIWAVGTGDTYFYGKTKKQFIINFNYFISCKNDLIPSDNYRWGFLDYVFTTSLLGSTVVSAQTGAKLDRCIELGFPRNDSLFNTDKKQIILNWIEQEIGFVPTKIIVYAPTYRDYEKNSKEEIHRELFGYRIPELESFLKKNHYCMICKLHNLTSKATILLPKGVIFFKLSYDFSFYDLLAITDCLITDYSSVGYDYLLLNKPILYNLYDLDRYTKDRGMSYEPYIDFCPGEIVKNEAEMIKALNDFSNGLDSCVEKRQRLMRLFHKYSDSQSTERTIKYFSDRFGFEYVDREKNN